MSELLDEITETFDRSEALRLEATRRDYCQIRDKCAAGVKVPDKERHDIAERLGGVLQTVGLVRDDLRADIEKKRRLDECRRILPEREKARDDLAEKAAAARKAGGAADDAALAAHMAIRNNSEAKHVDRLRAAWDRAEADKKLSENETAIACSRAVRADDAVRNLNIEIAELEKALSRWPEPATSAPVAATPAETRKAERPTGFASMNGIISDRILHGVR